MGELADILVRQDGVLSTAQAIRLVGRAALRWKLHTGAWQRVAPRALVTHSGPLTERQRLEVDLIRAGRDAVLAGLTAARLDGMAWVGPDATHVLVPSTGRHVPRPGLVAHRDASWSEAVHPARSPRRSRLPRAVVDGARWAATDRSAAGLLLAAVQQRLVRVDDLRAELAQRPGRRRSELIRSVLDDATLGAGSTLEADLLSLCRYLCLPSPNLQVRTTDTSGRTRWLDAEWPEFGVMVEIDGAFHLELREWWGGPRRQNDLWISGRVVLRFPGVALRLDRPVVADQLVAALSQGGWTVDGRTQERIGRLRL